MGWQAEKSMGRKHGRAIRRSRAEETRWPRAGAAVVGELLLGPLVILILVGGVAASPSHAQERPAYENLHVLPADIERSELSRIMLANLQGLGLPRRANEGCLFCHVGSMDVPASEWDWASDQNPMKVKARAMMGMVREINETWLAGIERTSDREVGCFTCHTGRTNPLPLPELLLREYRADGVAAVIDAYLELRGRYFAAGAYDFRTPVLAGVAAAVAEGGSVEDAAAIHRLNIETTGDPLAHQGLIRLRMMEALDEDGVEAMVRRYRDSEAEHPIEAYTPSLLSGLGWTLSRGGREVAGFRLFELNYEVYPDTYTATEDLAWGNELMGNHERALALAREWLERNPRHGLGERLLADLIRG